MTTIAVKKSPSGKVQIAWDSQATSGNTATRNTIKVRKVNSQFAVGSTGMLRYANIVQRASVEKIHPADIIDPDFDAEGWLIDTLVPAWGKALSEGAEVDPDGDAAFGASIIVLAGRIFELGVDYSVCDLGDFGAVGSGGQFATAAMHLGKSAKVAVEIAAELDLYTGGDVRSMTL